MERERTAGGVAKGAREGLAETYLPQHIPCLTALFPGLPGWAGTRKAKTNLDFTEASDNEWQ